MAIDSQRVIARQAQEEGDLVSEMHSDSWMPREEFLAIRTDYSPKHHHYWFLLALLEEEKEDEAYDHFSNLPQGKTK